MKKFNKSIEGLSIEEYLFSYVKFMLFVGEEITSEKIEDILTYYTKKYLELEEN